jgi:hypothetical protein
MRRFLPNLARLGSPARRVRRATPNARPGLEVLEGRDVPSCFSSLTDIGDAWHSLPGDFPGDPVTSHCFPQPPLILVPSVWQLVGRPVTLAQPGNSSNAYGVLTITSVTSQPDGTYTFEASYQTTQYHDSSGKLITSFITKGTIGLAQYAGPGIDTCTISFDAATTAGVKINGVTTFVNEHVHYNGTLSLSLAQITLTGSLYDCLENPVTHDRINPLCGSVPASGKFA